jgi:histidinol dehydrogenase
MIRELAWSASFSCDCIRLAPRAAGPNHALPTGGTARFFSPLGVWEFDKASRAVATTREGLAALCRDVIALAEAEDLTAHAENSAPNGLCLSPILP